MKTPMRNVESLDVCFFVFSFFVPSGYFAPVPSSSLLARPPPAARCFTLLFTTFLDLNQSRQFHCCFVFFCSYPNSKLTQPATWHSP